MTRFIKVASDTVGGEDVVVNVTSIAWMYKSNEDPTHTMVKFLGDRLIDQPLELNMTFAQLQNEVINNSFP